jgi:hypothetical protein
MAASEMSLVNDVRPVIKIPPPPSNTSNITTFLSALAVRIPKGTYTEVGGDFPRSTARISSDCIFALSPILSNTPFTVILSFDNALNCN